MSGKYYIIPAVVAVAALGSWLTSFGIPGWYNTLTLPSIAPSGGVIGTVWTIIFILSGIAVLLIWNARKKIEHYGWIIGLLIANAVLNVAWSYIFFVQHLLFWAIMEMVVLNLTTLAVMVLGWRRARLAVWLLLPYFVWVSFATYLAYQIWFLN